MFSSIQILYNIVGIYVYYYKRIIPMGYGIKLLLLL